MRYERGRRGGGFLSPEDKGSAKQGWRRKTPRASAVDAMSPAWPLSPLALGAGSRWRTARKRADGLERPATLSYSRTAHMRCMRRVFGLGITTRALVGNDDCSTEDVRQSTRSLCEVWRWHYMMAASGANAIRAPRAMRAREKAMRRKPTSVVVTA